MQAQRAARPEPSEEAWRADARAPGPRDMRALLDDNALGAGATALKLFAAVALLVAGAGLLARWARLRATRRAGSAAAIDVIAVRSLGPRHRVAVIETAGRRLLVGLAGDHICNLLDLSEGAEFAQALGAQLPPAQPESAAPLVSAIGRFEGLDG